MATTIGEALVRLQGDSSGLSRSLQTGKAQLDVAARRAGESAGRAIAEGTRRGLGGMIGGLVDQLGKIGLAAAGIKAVGSAVTSVFAGPIMAASDLNEAVNKTDVVFGKAAKGIHEFARGAAQAMGMSRTEAEAYAGTFGNLLVSMGMGQNQAAGYSKSILTLASDMASFNNASPVEVLEAIRAGLVGESEPLRRFGVNLSAAAIEQEALRVGIKKSYQELTTAEKAQLAYNIIQRQTATAHGDFARTSTGMANSLRIIRASWADIKTEIGNRLLPVIAPLVSSFARSLPTALKIVTPLLDLFGKVVARTFRAVRGVVVTLVDWVSALRKGDIGYVITDFREWTGIDLSRFAKAFGNLTRAFAPFRTALSGITRLIRGDIKGWYQLQGFLANIGGMGLVNGIERFAKGIQTFGQYLGNVARTGHVFAEGFNDLPRYLRPVAQIVGSLTSLFRGFGGALLDLLEGDISLRGFFERTATLVRQRGSLILSAFGSIGKSIWGYLFDTNDATGQSRATTLALKLRGWIETKARDTFSLAKGLGLDLYGWIFGTGEQKAAGEQSGSDKFLAKHKTSLTTTARALFGAKGGLAISVLSFIFGELGEGEDVGSKVSTFLGKVRAWFTPENVKNALATGGAIITDIWTFLFGGEKRVEGTAGASGKTTWADGIVSQLFRGIQAALGLQPALVPDVGALLFGKTVIVDQYGTTRRVSGLLDSLTKAFGDAVSKIPWDQVWAQATGIASGLASWLASKIDEVPDESWVGVGNAIGSALKDVAITIILLPSKINFALDTGEVDGIKEIGRKLGLMLAGALMGAFATDRDDQGQAAQALAKGDWMQQLVLAGAKFGMKLGEGIWQGILDGFGAQDGSDLMVMLLSKMTAGWSPLARQAILGAFHIPQSIIQRINEGSPAPATPSGGVSGIVNQNAWNAAWGQGMPLGGVTVQVTQQINADVSPENAKAWQVELVDAILTALAPYRTGSGSAAPRTSSVY